MILHRSILSLLALSLFSLSACTSGGGSDDEGSSNGNNSSEETAEGSFRTDCGVAIDGEVKNPVDASEGIRVFIDRFVSNNVLVASPASGAGGDILVRIHGIADGGGTFQEARARNVQSSFSRSAILFPPEVECTTTVEGGGTALVANMVSDTSGDSYAEELLLNGGASARSGDVCGGSLIGSCYQALQEEGESANPPVGADVSNFLWKPVSEKNGRVAVLLSPRATVFANGEELEDFGPSNGRATTARGSRPGCAYGANVRVQAIDSQGRYLVFPDGSTTFIIGNGCDRVEFQ